MGLGFESQRDHRKLSASSPGLEALLFLGGASAFSQNRLENERHILSIEVGTFAGGHGLQVTGYEKVAHSGLSKNNF